jgi:hypothetical protein
VGRDEAEVGAAPREVRVAAVGEDDAKERGAAEQVEVAEDGRIAGHAAPALAD